MKRNLLNSNILKELSLLGEADQIIVASAAFPAIEGVKVLDISLVPGVPSVEQVIDAFSEEIEIDMITVSDEAKEENVDFVEYLNKVLPPAVKDFQSYRQLKVIARNTQAIIRTGDLGLYKTSILRVKW